MKQATTILLLSLLVCFESTLAQGLYIQQGGRLTLRGNVQLVLHNARFTNDGQFLPGNSMVVFTGETPTTIGGTAGLNFDKVVVNKTDGQIVMQSTASVSSKIMMSSGLLELNNHELQLHPNALIEGENENTHITGVNGGSISISKVMQGSLLRFNPGNIGIELSTRVAPGLLVVKRRHTSESSPNGMSGINRSFEVQATNNDNLSASVRFHYLDAEHTEKDESALIMWKTNNVSVFWTPIGKTDADTEANWVQQHDIQDWGRFTLAGTGAVSSSNKRTAIAGTTLAEGKTTMQAYPNPARKNFTTTIRFNEEKDVVIGLYNQEGKLMQRKKVHLTNGITTVQWDLHDYARGTYYLYAEKININSIKIVKD